MSKEIKKEGVPEIKDIMKETKDVSEIDLSLADKKATSSPDNIKDDGYNLKIIINHDAKTDVTFIPAPDPYYEYRYLNSKSLRMTTKTGNLLLQGGGWQVVPKEHALKIGFSKSGDLAEDGTRRLNELVLARIPKEYFDEKEAAKKESASVPLKRIRRIKEEGDIDDSYKIAGTGHPSMKGLQTAEQLGMKK